MRRKFHPYTLLLLVSSTLIFGLGKLDKHSFYHHFFRVIAEMEQRNSTAADDLAVLRVTPEAEFVAQMPTMGGASGLSEVRATYRPEVVGASLNVPDAPRPRGQQLGLLAVAPLRAP